MKKLNHRLPNLFDSAAYKFIWQEAVDPIEATRREYNQELANNLNANFVGLMKSVNLLDASENDFEEADEANEILKNTPKKLGRNEADRLDRRNYKKANRKARKAVEKEKKARYKTLTKDEDRVDENFNDIDKKRWYSTEASYHRKDAFIASFEEIENELKDLRKAEAKLQAKIGMKHDFSSERKKVLESNLESSKDNKMLAEAGYVDVMIGALGEDVDGDAMENHARLKEVQAQKAMLEDMYQKYFKYYTLFTTPGLSTKAIKGYVKSFQAEVDTEAEKANKESIKAETVNKTEAELRDDPEVVAALADISTVKDTIDGFDTDIKAQQAIIDAAKAKPYQTDATRKEITDARAAIGKLEASKKTQTDEIKQKSNALLQTKIDSYERDAESVVLQARQLSEGVDNAIDAVKEKINSAPTNEDHKKELEQLQGVKAALENGTKITSVDAITNTNLQAALENNYNPVVEKRDQSELDITVIKQIFAKDKIPFDDKTSTAPMDYNSILRRQDVREAQKEQKQAQDRLRESIEKERDERKSREALARTARLEMETKILAGDFDKDADVRAYEEARTDLTNNNKNINNQVAYINDLKREVIKLKAANLDPTATSLELDQAQERLKVLAQKRKTALDSMTARTAKLEQKRKQILEPYVTAVTDARSALRNASATPDKSVKTLQDDLNTAEAELNLAGSVLATRINALKDISNLLPSNEAAFNTYINTVISDDTRIITYGEVKNRTNSGPAGTASYSAGSGVVNRVNRIQDKDLKNVPDYKVRFDAEEVTGLTTVAQLKAKVALVVTEKSMQNEVIKLMNLGPVMAVSQSRLTRIGASNGRVKFGTNELVLKVQVQDPRTNETMSDLYYKVGADGQLTWLAAVDTNNDGTVDASLKPQKAYGFKQRYDNPAALANYLGNGLKRDIQAERKIIRQQDHLKKLVEQISTIDNNVITSYDLSYPEMHLNTMVYNAETEDSFAVRFTLNEKGQWVIEEEDFDDIDELDQAALKKYGIRGNKPMSRAYFQQRLAEVARHGEDDKTGPIRKFFRKIGTTVRSGWQWVKGIFGY